MKKRAALLVAGMVISFSCLLGSGIEAQATNTTDAVAMPDLKVNVTPHMAYLTMKEDVEVHVMPGTSWEVIGKLSAGQPAIATGKTDGGWTQVYYIGRLGYIPGDAAQDYMIPEPTVWQDISIDGEIKINALGDSITFGDKLNDMMSSWPYLLGAQCEAVKVNNYGWNGSCVGGIHPDKLLDRYTAMDRDANLVFVFGGTNDYGGYNYEGTTIGKIGDVSPDCFYGALNLMMCGLKQMYPDAEIVFMTPLRRDGYMRRNKNGYYLGQYVTAIHEMAAFYGIRVLDLYNEPELDFAAKSSLYLVDGLHPNEMGQALISAHIYRKLFEDRTYNNDMM